MADVCFGERPDEVVESSIRKQIALLQDLRTRLVSDAVTGAVEVS